MPGRINWGGLLLVFLLVLGLGTWDVFNLIIEAIRPAAQTDQINVIAVVIIFAVILFICMAMAMYDSHLRRRAGRKD